MNRKIQTIAAAVLALAALCLMASAAPQGEQEILTKVDEIFARVSDIMGMKIERPVPRAIINRDKVREHIERRMNESLSPKEIHGQEVVLKKFGFVPQDFDLKSQTLDLLTEQAAAFYDFKEKKLYIASWTSSGMQDVALVHELAHALADQHFKLEKFIEKSGDDDDAATARGAVVEGQASWVMTEYTLRQMGRSLRDAPSLLQSAIESTADAAKDYPVFSAAPLYLRETLMFPYTQGLLFQQAVFQKQGRASFAEVFRRPPVSSQQVIHPDLYFSRAMPTKPALPNEPMRGGYKKLGDGTMGELDHQLLLRQFAEEDEARELAPRWRGGRYALWENKKENRAVLLYAVEWASEADAVRYFGDYRKAAAKKWKKLKITLDEPTRVTGSGDDGRFVWTRRGAVFASAEGLP